MYVCICHAVNEKKIKEHLDQGASHADLRRRLGVGSSCGKCHNFVCQLIERERGAAVSS